jgi:hypothetical protein
VKIRQPTNRPLAPHISVHNNGSQSIRGKKGRHDDGGDDGLREYYSHTNLLRLLRLLRQSATLQSIVRFWSTVRDTYPFEGRTPFPEPERGNPSGAGKKQGKNDILKHSGCYA